VLSVGYVHTDPPESTSRREEVLASGQPASLGDAEETVGLGIRAVAVVVILVVVVVVVVVVNIGRTSNKAPFLEQRFELLEADASRRVRVIHAVDRIPSRADDCCAASVGFLNEPIIGA